MKKGFTLFCFVPASSGKIVLRMLILLSMLTGAAMLQAQTNPKISIQGTLKTADGVTVGDGPQTVRFNLYDVPEGGTPVWFEDTTVEVIGGIYSYYLGSKTPLVPANFAKTLYLGVKIGSYELVPRTELSYSPYAFSVYTAVCSGAVGDVKYSILNPTQFAAENGPCWVPMDGRALAPTDRLRIVTGRTNVPDGGGLFLRAQEFATSPNNDPGRTSASPIATLQADEVGSHTHSITDPGHRHNITDVDYTTTNDHNGGTEATSVDNIPVVDKLTEFATTGITINPSTGAETRPKNLNFWIYIRIN